MGLKTSYSILVGGETFGIRTTIYLFKAFGKTPCIIDELYISLITGTSPQTKVLRILSRSIFGPGDLVALISRSFL